MDVISGLKDIDTDIDALRGRKKDHALIVANIFENLKALEDSLWDDLVALSRDLIKAAANGKRHAHRWVRWGSKNNSHRWGSLW